MKKYALGLLLLSLTPVDAQADYLCTYKSYYGLQNEGLLEQRTGGVIIGKRFTVNMDGETGGEIVGDFEVYDDGKREGFAFKAQQKEASGQQLLRMLDPQKYAEKDEAAKLNKERSIPRVLYIETYAEGEEKPFILYWMDFLFTGTCEQL